MADATIQTTQKTIVIDPGHGGSDPGRHTSSGLSEKQITLDLAQKTARHLEAGYNVLLTRQDDHLAGTEERIFTANKSKADLFISLHLHGGAQSDLLIYHYGATSISVPPIQQKKLISWRQAAQAHQQKSLSAARLISEKYSSHSAGGTASIHRIPVIPIEGADMPALLIEVTAIDSIPTHPAKREAVLEKYAAALAEGINHYFLILSSDSDK